MAAQPLIERLRQMADDMQDEIELKLGPRLDNTPKRQREAMSARIDGRQLQRVQAALRALADARDAGALPAILDSLKTKSAIAPLLRKVLTSTGYYHIAETNDYHDQTPQGQALRALIDHTETPAEKATSEAQTAKQKIEAMEQQLRFANIAGFFPTPPAIVARMIQEADIRPGHKVLEPSAGKGDIAEAARAARANVICIERNHSLCQILLEKGFTTQTGDFMDFAPADVKDDRIVMNPPFEKGQDAEHVRHAFNFLAPGGRLVAIMSAGTFSRSDRKTTDFRAWLDDQLAVVEDLPADAFKSGFVSTGVATKLVIIDAAPAQQQEDTEAGEQLELFTLRN